MRADVMTKTMKLSQLVRALALERRMATTRQKKKPRVRERGRVQVTDRPTDDVDDDVALTRAWPGRKIDNQCLGPSHMGHVSQSFLRAKSI